jgi:hypothetical protein
VIRIFIEVSTTKYFVEVFDPALMHKLISLIDYSVATGEMS